MKKITSTLSLITLALLFGCTTPGRTEDEKLSDKIHQQEPANSPQAIAMRAAETFSAAPGLTAEQKMKLRTIYSRVYAESMAIRQEIGQSKSLLFMNLANVDYKSKEVTNLKNKIVSLDQRRLKIMFDALDDVQAVVGKGIEAEKIYKYLYEFENPSKFDRMDKY